MRALLRICAGAGSLLSAVLVGMLVFSRFPWHVERWYVEGAGPLLQGLLVLVTARLPFGLAEWVEALAALVGLVALIVGLGLLWLRRGERRRLLMLYGAILWAAIAAVGVYFYASWGLSYARPRAEERLGWVGPGEELREVTPEELLDLSERLVDKVNDLYVELHGWPDGYAVTVASRSLGEGGLRAADAAIDRGYERLVEELHLHPSVAASRGPVKPLLSSVLFSWIGIGGFYFPFTGEANIDADAPEWQQAHTLAHEKAHQRFFASENEANFFGFLAAIHTDDPFVQYGGWLFAQRQVLVALGAVDPWGFHQVVYRRHPGVQRDINYAREFWEQYEGPVSQLGDAINDRYLRFNGVDGGIESYRQSVELVVEWCRRAGVK